MKNEDKKIGKMITMSEHLNEAMRDGFVENFCVWDGRLATNNKVYTYGPDEIRITDFFRFEGESSPEDSAILYLIETADGKRGTLVDAYGANADASRADFIRKVESIAKKITTDGR